MRFFWIRRAAVVTKRKNYIWAELKLPTRIPDRIARIGAIIARVDGNPRYPTLQSIVTSLKPAYAELRAAQTDVASGTRGKPAVRDRKMVICEQILEQLRLGVEGLANDDVENGPSIIEGALMFVRARSTRKKQPEELGPGPYPGSVKMSIRAVKGAGAYVREWSADGGCDLEQGATDAARPSHRHGRGVSKPCGPTHRDDHRKTAPDVPARRDGPVRAMLHVPTCRGGRAEAMPCRPTRRARDG